MIRLITSFISDKDILKATKSRIPIIFLGGECKDNEWRNDIKKEFGEDLYVLDPFDNNYDPAKNIYKEIAGMLNSDYVIFYKGGKQTDREKDFLDLIKNRNNVVKEFKDVDDIREFLIKIRNGKLKSVGSKVKKCAEELIKEATIYLHNKHGKLLDLFFDKLDDRSIVDVINDLLKGKTITLPALGEGVGKKTELNLKDVPDYDLRYFMKWVVPGSDPPSTSMEKVKKTIPFRPPVATLFRYDPVTQSYIDKRITGEISPEEIEEHGGLGYYKKEAKKNVVYDYYCIKINLPPDLSKSIIKWGKDNVPDEDLYVEEGEAKGREDDIHITVFYGIKDDNPAKVLTLISKAKPFEIRLGLINLFKDNKKYDVLKIEVESGDLERLHYDIEKRTDNENTYPTYKPHVTVGYIKKGTADKFVGDESFKGKTFKVDNIVFSDGKNEEKKLPLGI